LLDARLLRENPGVVRTGLERRGFANKLALVDEALECDVRWRKLKTQVDDLRHRQNLLTAEVASLKKLGKSAEEKLVEVKGIPERIRALDREAEERLGRLNAILLSLPNPLHDSVPTGAGEEQNVQVKAWGEKTHLEFEAKHHVDLLSDLGMVDMERAAKVAGARFSFLLGDAVKLEHAIMQYALDLLRKKGFTAVEPPFMMNREAYSGVVNLEDFGPVIYKIEGENLHLIATAEHPLVSMRKDEIIDGSSLPVRYCGLSPCFRVEAGSHGKDTKGIFRAHQFYKVEQVVFSRPEESRSIHEELVANVEQIYREFGIPHRVVLLCSGDTGFMSAKTYDIEAWLPSQKRYREMASASNVTDFQARRLLIRYRDKQGDPTRLVHTLNSSAVVTRTLVAIVENFQQRDGTVTIPEPLVPYMGGVKRLERQSRL
jgi:seryl-tRNA synthetase